MSAAELKELREEVKNYVDHADEKALRMMYALAEADHNADWWNTMPAHIKAEVEESMLQADNGAFITHDQAKKKYPQWFTK